MVKEKRWVFAGVHRFAVVVYEGFLVGTGWATGIIDGVAPCWGHWVTGRDPAMHFYFWRMIDVDDCISRLGRGNGSCTNYIPVFASAARRAMDLSSKSVCKLGLSWGEKTARKGGMKSWTSSSNSMIWKPPPARLNRTFSLPGRVKFTMLMGLSASLPNVYESACASQSDWMVWRSSGSIPQYGSKSL